MQPDEQDSLFWPALKSAFRSVSAKPCFPFDESSHASILFFEAIGGSTISSIEVAAAW